jgi:predicted Zn-dependent peptidase
MRNTLINLICGGILVTFAITTWAGQTSAGSKQTPPAGGPPKAFQLPALEKFSLPNGLQVTMAQFGSIPKVQVSVAVRAGSLNEPASQVWLSELTGRLMKEGTTSKTAEQVAQEAASMGGSIDIQVGPDITRIDSDVLSEFGPKIVTLLADVMMHPLLPDSDVPRLKQDLQRKLSIDLTQPGTLAHDRFVQVLYPDHPYGRLLSTEATISSFTDSDVKKFYEDNFSAARTHIYVAGKFDPAAVKKAVTAAFSDWKRGPDPLVQIPKPVSKRELDIVDRPGAAQSTLYIGLPAIDPSNPDYIPLQVMDALLGGSFGSRITANIREQKGYTYSPRSQVSVRYRDGYWAEVADVTTAVTGPSIKEILYEIDRLQNAPPSAAELDGIKNYLAGLFVIRNSNRAGVVNQLQFVDLHRLGDTYLNTYVQNVHAVTPEQVQEMAKKYVVKEKLTIVVVGDKQKVSDQTAPYAN